MRALWFVAFFVGLGANFSSGQQTSPSASAPVADAKPAHVKVYAVGPDVTAPELLPPNLILISAEKCKKKVDGKVVLSVLVDETGKPRNIMFLKPLGSDLDKLALQLVSADRFKPGMHNGTPVVVGQSVEISMQSCIVEKTDDTGRKTSWLRLKSQPEQKFRALSQPTEEAVLTPISQSLEDAYKAAVPFYRVGGEVSAPVVLNYVDPEFTDEARRAKYSGVCIVSLIVDAYGRPQYMRVVRALKYGLSEKAIEAVSRFRFKPAMKNGMPVPVKINIMVAFRLY